MASESEVSPEQSPQQLSVSVLADVVSSLNAGAHVQALPQQILRPLLVSLWETSAPADSGQSAPPVAELTISRDTLEALEASPLGHVLADLAVGELAVYVAELSEPTPALFYDQQVAITPYMLSDDEAFFVEMHPPTGDPITHDRSPISQLPETTKASKLVQGFESAIPGGEPAALQSALEAYAELSPTTPVDIGYLLTIAGSCTGIQVRHLGDWAESEGLFSLDAAHRRKRKLHDLGLISVERAPTGKGGNNVDRIELGDGGEAPESILESDLVALGRSLREEWQ